MEQMKKVAWYIARGIQKRSQLAQYGEALADPSNPLPSYPNLLKG